MTPRQRQGQESMTETSTFSTNDECLRRRVRQVDDDEVEERDNCDFDGASSSSMKAAATPTKYDAMKTATTSPSHASSNAPPSSLGEMTFPWLTAIVWPLMLTVPLLLTTDDSPLHYTKVFKPQWYEYEYDAVSGVGDSPKPLGLSLGLLAVAVGQLLCLFVFYFFKFGFLSFGKEPLSIQTKGARPYQFLEGLTTHLSQPEGFILLGGYLSLTWMFRWMPQSYYSFDGGIEWPRVFACLVVQDGIQYLMHLLEHNVHPAFYRLSHKPHHKFTNPRLFDAFNGSIVDTVCMILIPLYSTANLVHCNVWSYMAFGSLYANWLTLIHSEYTFPWDQLFHAVGFGTPADHHVHHAFFKFNFGHLFMWFDMIGGTYKSPNVFAPKRFNERV